MTERICSEPDCDQPFHALGFCKRHHARENYRANIEQRRAQQAAYRAARKAENRQRVAAWRAANPDRVAELSRRYYADHREEALEYRRRYREENRDKIRAANQRRKRLQRGATVHDLTLEQWAEIQALFVHRCAYCGRDDRPLTQDHLIALSRGGGHTATNVVPACQPCNSRKGDRPAPPFHPMFRQE